MKILIILKILVHIIPKRTYKFKKGMNYDILPFLFNGMRHIKYKTS